jgi:hypothetical protein
MSTIQTGFPKGEGEFIKWQADEKTGFLESLNQGEHDKNDDPKIVEYEFQQNDVYDGPTCVPETSTTEVGYLKLDDNNEPQRMKFTTEIKELYTDYTDTYELSKDDDGNKVYSREYSFGGHGNNVSYTELPNGDLINSDLMGC